MQTTTVTRHLQAFTNPCVRRVVGTFLPDMYDMIWSYAHKRVGEKTKVDVDRPQFKKREQLHNWLGNAVTSIIPETPGESRNTF